MHTQSMSARWLALCSSLLSLNAFAACAPSDFDQAQGESSACEQNREEDGNCPSELDGGSDGGESADGARQADDLEDMADADQTDDEPCADCPPSADAGLADSSAYDMLEAGALCPGSEPQCAAEQVESETRPCMGCGSGVQTRTRSCAPGGCNFGEWSGWSGCSITVSECSPDQREEEVKPCGTCNLGTQKRVRSCATSCTWGAWGDFSACSAMTLACTPGKVETQSEACGDCNSGKRTRTRTCSTTSCSFGEWSAWSACGGVTAACTPGKTRDCSPSDSCGHSVCSNSCTWGACQPKQPGGCLRRRGGTQEEGSNYRCCGASRWQFCLPSCTWSPGCDACSQGEPDWCSDC